MKSTNGSVSWELLGGRTYCTAGATCNPPSKFPGITKKFSAFGSLNGAVKAPWIPGCDDTVNLESVRDQHSMVDSLFALAERVVMLSGYRAPARRPLPSCP